MIGRCPMKKTIPLYYKNLSLKTKLLLSYILLFAIPLCILGIGGYKWISDTVSGYAQKAYTNMLEKIIQDNDVIYNQLDTLTEQLSNTTWVKKIISMQGDAIDESRVDAWSKYEYYQNMRALKSAIEPVDELGILFTDKNAVISSFGTSDYKFMAENAFHIDGMGVTQWNELIKNLGIGKSLILPGRTMTKYGVPRYGILYVRPLDLTTGYREKSVVFAFINKASVEESLQSLLIDEGIRVTISEPGKQPFLASGADSVQEPLNIHLTSQKTGWEYGMAIPSRLIVRSAENVRNAILVVVGLLCLICFGVALGFMRNLYRPVGELVSLVRGYIGENRAREARNEYSWLQDGIHAMVEHENALIEELESRKPMLRDAWLGRLVAGSTEPRQEFEKALALLGIDMPHPVWRICVAIWREKPDGENRQLTERMSVLPVVTGLVCYAFILEDRCVAVLNYADEGQLQAYVGQCACELTEVLLGMGNAYGSLDGAARSYAEAIAALDYRLLGQDSLITWYSSICDNRNCYYYPLEMEYKISSCLRSGDAEAAVAMLRSALASNLGRRGASMESIRNLLTNMELTALKALDEAGAGSGMLPDNGLGHAARGTDDVSQMSDRVEKTFITVGSIIREKNEASPSAQERIVRFVDASITNNALSLTLVAERFSVSPSYISRMFTESFGENYHRYVNEKRIAIARELLVSRPDIASVARAAGYDSDVTFRRVFKQTMGISPSEYRERLKHAGSADSVIS